MTTKELVKVGSSLGLEVSHLNKNYVCFKGINDQVSIFYTDENIKPSKMKDFAVHLKLMGRDELRMTLNEQLSITRHL